MVTNIDYEIVRGDTGGFRLAITDTSDAPIDISDYSIYFTAKRSYNGADLIETITGSIADAENGLFVISIPSTATEELPIGTFVYDIQMNDGTGIKTTLFNGNFKVLPECTTGV